MQRETVGLGRPTHLTRSWLVAIVVLTVAVTPASFADSNMQAGVILPADQLEWTPVAEGSPIHVATVWGDRNEGESGFLIKLPAGFEVGVHAHTGDYHGVLIAGTWIHIEEDGSGQDQELSPGSYVHQPGKAWHDDWCKAGGADCIILVHQHEKGDFIPKETPAE